MIGFIKEGFDKVFGIIDKTVVDKDKKAELEAAVKEVQLNSEIEMQKIINGRTNTLLEKCISVVFPLIAFAFFLHLITNVLCFGYALIQVNLWYSYLLTKDYLE